MRRAAVASAVLALALSGCGGGSADDGGEPAGGETTTAAGGAEGELSVAEAREAGGAVTVRGYVHVLTEPMLCNGLDTSSFPPACVAPTLKIANPAAIADLQLEQVQGTEFARKPVKATGTVNGDSITVEEVSTD